MNAHTSTTSFSLSSELHPSSWFGLKWFKFISCKQSNSLNITKLLKWNRRKCWKVSSLLECACASPIKCGILLWTFIGSYMAGFSQPQHFFAAARLFWVFGSMRSSIGSSRIFMGSRIFLFEVLGHSDFQVKKYFGHFGGRMDPPNLETFSSLKIWVSQNLK